MRPTIGDMPMSVLRKMVKRPMTPLEVQPAPTTKPRGSLKPNERWQDFVYVNTRYSVQVSTVDVGMSLGEVTHLWIRRHDGEMPRSWSDMQRIKNEVCGADRTGVEVFPPQGELVDQANMAHLWVYPADYVMPFSLGGGR